MSSAICFNLDQSKILSSGNGLKRDGCIINMFDIETITQKGNTLHISYYSTLSCRVTLLAIISDAQDTSNIRYATIAL